MSLMAGTQRVLFAICLIAKEEVMNFREVRGKTLHRLTLNVRRWREKGYETVGGVFKTADGYAVIMSRAGGSK